jgi:hypothetical protein
VARSSAAIVTESSDEGTDCCASKRFASAMRVRTLPTVEFSGNPAAFTVPASADEASEDEECKRVKVGRNTNSKRDIEKNVFFMGRSDLTGSYD